MDDGGHIDIFPENLLLALRYQTMHHFRQTNLSSQASFRIDVGRRHNPERSRRVCPDKLSAYVDVKLNHARWRLPWRNPPACVTQLHIYARSPSNRSFLSLSFLDVPHLPFRSEYPARGRYNAGLVSSTSDSADIVLIVAIVYLL